MAYCGKCGNQIDEGVKFCPACGTAVTSAAEVPDITEAPAQKTDDNKETRIIGKVPGMPAESPAPAETVTRPPLLETQAQPACKDMPPAPGSRYEPITTKGFIGIMFLMLIPLVNLLLLLVWAFGGCRKVNKQNFAKAMLVWMLIGIGLSIVFGLIFWSFFPADGLQGLQESLLMDLKESMTE